MHERLGLRGVVVWSLAFCAHRAAILWWGFNGLYYWEETYRLLVAEALLRRWPWPLLDLQADPYAGGSLVVSLLTAPVVALVGPSLVGLKLVALLWSAAGFVAWTLLVDRYWGRRAAHVFAFLFVFAPPLFVTYNLIAMGSYAEIVTLGGIQLLLAYRYLYGEERSTPALMLWAAVAGLGTWYAYVSILPFAVCVVVGLVGGALPPRRWPALVAGFTIGLAPWILSNVESGGRGFDVVARTFRLRSSDRPRSPTFILVYLGYLVQTGIPLGLQYPEVFAPLTAGAPRRLLLARVYLGTYLLAWGMVLGRCLAAAWRGALTLGMRLRSIAATCPALPVLLLFPALVPILAVSDQVFLEHPLVPYLSFRVLVPFLPPVMVVLAIAAAALPTWPRWATIAVLGLIGAAGTMHSLAPGSSARPRLEAQARTIGAVAAGHLLYYKHGADFPLLDKLTAAMPEELRGPTYEGVGFSVAYHYPDDLPLSGFVTVVRQAPPGFQADVVRGARLALGPGIEQVAPRPPSPRTAALLAAIASLDPPNPDQ